MRKALRSNSQKSAIAYSASIPAPTGGWDTESPLGKMPPKNAVILDNWIPRAAFVELRRGFIDQVTGSGKVEEMIVWRGLASGDKLFACSGAHIYDITTRGGLPAAAWSSAHSARWESCNFANDAGDFAICANGVDTPLYYNGTIFQAAAITGTAGVIVLDPKTLRAPMMHKRRLWFIQKDSLRTWFLGTNAIQGAATLLDLGPLFTKGGYLRAQGTWSLDSGAGMDDVAVFITSEGQVAIYQGLDPTDANQWSLVGVFDLSRPVGDRPLMKWGSDLSLVTEDGIVPLSQALSKDREQAKKIALTAKISTAFSNASLAYKTNYGWCSTLYSGRGSLAIFNIPTGDGTAIQFVQSIETGSWCRFVGLDAICWAQANDQIYFGALDGVFRWDTGSSDNSATVYGDIKSAFSAFGRPAQTKQFTMLRPQMRCPVTVRPALEMLVDYAERVPTAVPTVVDPGDISTQDQDVIRGDWTSATGLGYVGAARMRVGIVSVIEGSLLAVDEPLSDLVIDAPGGDTILVAPDLPLDVDVEVIGFDVLFQLGSFL